MQFFRGRRAATLQTEPAPSSGPPPDGALEEIIRSAVERLLEDEALTADLVDTAARRLLDWGIAQATATLRETGALTDEARARLDALRGRMREIARQVGPLPPEEQASAVQRWLDGAGLLPERTAATSTEDTVKEEG